MPTPQASSVDTYSFLNLADKRWWKFKDTSSGYEPVTVECKQLSSDKLQLTTSHEHNVQILPDIVMTVKNVPVGGHLESQYTWIQWIWSGQTITWPQQGVAIPVNWKVGEILTATSGPHANPATGNAIHLSLTLNKPSPIPLPGGLHIPPGTETVAIVLQVNDVGLGTGLASGTLSFAKNVGLYSAKGQNFGNFYVLELKAWSGGH